MINGYCNEDIFLTNFHAILIGSHSTPLSSQVKISDNCEPGK